jgi:hypothetical protein
VRARLLSREIAIKIGVPTRFLTAEGDAVGGVMRESLADPARSENLGTHDKLHAREPGDPMVAPCSLMMPRPGWFTGWQIDEGGGRGGER